MLAKEEQTSLLSPFIRKWIVVNSSIKIFHDYKLRMQWDAYFVTLLSKISLFLNAVKYGF